MLVVFTRIPLKLAEVSYPKWYNASEIKKPQKVAVTQFYKYVMSVVSPSSSEYINSEIS